MNESPTKEEYWQSLGGHVACTTHSYTILQYLYWVFNLISEVSGTLLIGNYLSSGNSLRRSYSDRMLALILDCLNRTRKISPW